MSNYASTKTLNKDSITLPKEWKGRTIYIRRYDDTIVIKKVEVSEFWKTWEKIKTFSEDITSKDIEKAIKWARKAPNK